MRTVRRPTDRPAGFTLVELVLVIAIIGVIGVIAVPRWNAASTRYRADLATRRVLEDIELTRRAAMAAGAPRTLSFDVAAEGYTMAGQRSLDDRSLTYRVALGAEPYRVDIESADFGGVPDLAFDAYGAPAAGGTVVVRVAGYRNTITVAAPGGRTSVTLSRP